MLTTSSYTVTKTGTYYIYYQDKGVTGTAPATPAEIAGEAVFFTGNVLTFDMDSSIENCVVDSIFFLSQKDAES
ncbi:MAG: hypothetical protein IJJ33_09560, partial [Victivallales bacterium]|nr:hypothetical protein [Victivallales bacterium]